MQHIILPDLHGQTDVVKPALELLGALADGKRVEGFTITQVGDLIDGSGTSKHADWDALDLVHDGTIDTFLVGNHEYPFLRGTSGAGTWAGYRYNPITRDKLRALLDAGRLRAATAIEGTLLTHAGLVPEFAEKYGLESAQDAADTIEALWQEDPSLPIFKRIGQARGGFAETGGVLWSDFDEKRCLRFSQVHGHSPYMTPYAKWASDGSRRFALNIDTGMGKGGKVLGGALIDDRGTKIIEVDLAPVDDDDEEVAA